MKYEFLKSLFTNSLGREDYDEYHAGETEKHPEAFITIFKHQFKNKKYLALLESKGFFNPAHFTAYHREVSHRLLSLEAEVEEWGKFIKNDEAFEQCLVLFACSISLSWSLIKNNHLIDKVFPIQSEGLSDYRSRINAEADDLVARLKIANKKALTDTLAAKKIAPDLSVQKRSHLTSSSANFNSNLNSNSDPNSTPTHSHTFNEETKSQDNEAVENELTAEVYQHLAQELRLFKLREFIRIAIADYLDEDSLETTAGKVSAFADRVIHTAFSMTGLADEKVGVIAMGKLGGYELNYSSDIDIMFICEETVRLRNVAIERRIRKFTALLSDLTAEGNVFKVDMQIRPEGNAGELYLPPKAYMDYYTTRAGNWERQALIKARFVVGTESLNYAFTVLRNSILFEQDISSEQMLIDMFHMKQKIEHELTEHGHTRSPSKEFLQLKSNFKLGLGGIRDIEFLVQFLQLHHGKLTPALNEINTLNALKKLFNYKILSSYEAVTLTDNYRLLRKIEHRLQFLNLLPIRELPGDIKALDYLAGLCGYDKRHKVKAFIKDYQLALRNTRDLFDKIIKHTALFLTKMQKLETTLRDLAVKQSKQQKSHLTLKSSQKPLSTSLISTSPISTSPISTSPISTSYHRESLTKLPADTSVETIEPWRRELQKFESDYFINFNSEHILRHFKMLVGLSEAYPADAMITITTNHNDGKAKEIVLAYTPTRHSEADLEQPLAPAKIMADKRKASSKSIPSKNTAENQNISIDTSRQPTTSQAGTTYQIVLEIAAYSMIGAFSMVAGAISTKGINILSGFIFPQVDEQIGGRASADHFYRRSFAAWKDYAAPSPGDFTQPKNGSTLRMNRQSSLSMGGLIKSARKKTIIVIHGEFTNEAYAESFAADKFMEELREYFKLSFKGEIEKVREDIYLRALPFLEQHKHSIKINPVFIDIDNDSHLFYTVLRIKSEDIFLFLYQFTVSLSERRFRIAKAEFATEGSTIDNVIYVTERNRKKVLAKDRLQEIRVTLLLLNYFSNYIVFAPNPYLAFSQFSKLTHHIVDDYETAFTQLLTGGALFKKIARILGTSEAIFEDFFRSEAEDIMNYLSSEEILKIPHTEAYLEAALSKVLINKKYIPSLVPQLRPDKLLNKRSPLPPNKISSKTFNKILNKAPSKAPNEAPNEASNEAYSRISNQVSNNTDKEHAPSSLNKHDTNDDKGYKQQSSESNGQFTSNRVERSDPLTLLNQFKDDSMFAIDLRFLSGAVQDFQVFCQEITTLADVVIRNAYKIVEQQVLEKYAMEKIPGAVVILGLGKWGACEMGYASDIELMFVYQIADEFKQASKSDGADKARRFFEDLGRQLPLAIKSKKNGIFELDFRLRPDGETAPIAVSLGKFREYYTFQNDSVRNFERMALTRLRSLPVGGGAFALELEEKLVQLTNDFVYAAVPFDEAEFIKLRKMQLAQFTSPGVTNVKFSLGGLVDIEYFIQRLLITLGTKDSKVRNPHTLRAMELLYNQGYLKQDVFKTLRKAYHFYRILINSLRIVRGNAEDLEIPDPKSVTFHYLTRRLSLFKAIKRHENFVKRLELEVKKVRKITVPYM
ncbi:bifunctional glutamine synthetase adenylyltransferase/adenylyl-removing enzyme [Spirochaetota bacterium]|nr:bifunctional glutamine synthetase adenylyltransferase/adenylyl-removing enzyme [Spirochaetota bacterium]